MEAAGSSEMLVTTYMTTQSCNPEDHNLNIQGDRKVTQPILKYLFMVAVQYNSVGFLNTQYRCDYTRAHAGHIML
jgi:hypothetical protein